MRLCALAVPSLLLPLLIGSPASLAEDATTIHVALLDLAGRYFWKMILEHDRALPQATDRSPTDFLAR